MSEPPQPSEPSEPSSITRTYSNAVAAEGGPYDLALTFGLRIGTAEYRDQDVQVVMSWEHARALAGVLQAVISNYEAEMGDVRDIEQAAAMLAKRRQGEE